MSATLPPFDRASDRTAWIDVYNKGSVPFVFTAGASSTWIRVFPSSGTINDQTRVMVKIDWSSIPPGENTGTIRITGADAMVTVAVHVLPPMESGKGSTRAVLESDGHVSIEAEHVTGSSANGKTGWVTVPGYGHTLSGMRAMGAVDQPPYEPGRDTPCLTYDVLLRGGGEVRVTGVFGSTLNFLRDRDLRYAIAFDDQPPQIVMLLPKTFIAQHGDMVWEKFVADNAHQSTSQHTLSAGGRHVLRVWMVDPGVVLQKLIVDRGGVRPSYLGPPESPTTPGR